MHFCLVNFEKGKKIWEGEGMSGIEDWSYGYRHRLSVGELSLFRRNAFWM